MASIYRTRCATSGWVGAPGLNTFYFRVAAGDGATSGDVALLCATRVHAAFTDVKETFPTVWQARVDPVIDVLNDVNGDLVASYIVDSPALVSGGFGGGFVPTAAMCLLQLRTDTVIDSHRLRGRAFVGPMMLGVDANGSPTAGLITGVQAMGAALLDTGVGGPDLVVWHRPRLADPQAVPPVTARAGSSGVVTGVTVPDRFAVLRSRRD